MGGVRGGGGWRRRPARGLGVIAFAIVGRCAGSFMTSFQLHSISEIHVNSFVRLPNLSASRGARCRRLLPMTGRVEPRTRLRACPRSSLDRERPLLVIPETAHKPVIW